MRLEDHLYHRRKMRGDRYVAWCLLACAVFWGLFYEVVK